MRRQKSKKLQLSIVFLLLVLFFLITIIMFLVQLQSLQSSHSTKKDTIIDIWNKLEVSFENNYVVNDKTTLVTSQKLTPPPPPSSSSSLSLSSSLSSSSSSSSSSQPRRIGFAITITKDGAFLDGAAVLAYSIVKHSTIDTNTKISLIAFVHPNVTKSRPILKKIGYHVIEAPTPINSSAITFKWFREHIEFNGCCGSSELIKINAYRLLQYDKVVHMDADTMIINNIEEALRKDKSLVYTTDPNMASSKDEDKQPVQGGFIIIKPNIDDYLSIINIMMTTNFFNSGAWNKTRIGWYWGGMTVQGVLPYYYNKISSPGRTEKVDRCLYNTMADTEDCMTQSLSIIKSAHFTVCQKPWNCYKHETPLCNELHNAWRNLRKDAEIFYGIKTFENACIGGYKPMRLDSAKMPELPNIIPDDSPDFLEPIGNSGYEYPYNDINKGTTGLGGHWRKDLLKKKKIQ